MTRYVDLIIDFRKSKELVKHLDISKHLDVGQRETCPWKRGWGNLVSPLGNDLKPGRVTQMVKTGPDQFVFLWVGSIVSPIYCGVYCGCTHAFVTF